MALDLSVFVSYARTDESAVQLISDLGRVAERVWFDAQITGGQLWWDTILDQIEACDVLVIALSPAALRSEWCKIEAKWARDLGRPILPVQTADLSIATIPRWLRDRQIITHSERSVDPILAVVDAVTNLMRRSSPLTEPTPARPPMPAGPLDEEREKLGRSVLSARDQSKLVIVLKASLEDDDQREEAVRLLEVLAERDDVTRSAHEACMRALSSPKNEQAASMASLGKQEPETHASTPPLPDQAFLLDGPEARTSAPPSSDQTVPRDAAVADLAEAAAALDVYDRPLKRRRHETEISNARSKIERLPDHINQLDKTIHDETSRLDGLRHDLAAARRLNARRPEIKAAYTTPTRSWPMTDASAHANSDATHPNASPTPSVSGRRRAIGSEHGTTQSATSISTTPRTV